METIKQLIRRGYVLRLNEGLHTGTTRVTVLNFNEKPVANYLLNKQMRFSHGYVVGTPIRYTSLEAFLIVLDEVDK